MTISSLLFQFMIRPLELILEAVYAIAKLFLFSSGLSIFALSLTINIMLLPLYRRADAVQDEEREIERKMAPVVSHIKKTFTGDERFMMLQTYYRQNDYKPIYSLRGLLPLMLEIPFFIAAYHFLSNLYELTGMPFWIIRDLGAPDGLITVAGNTVNALPVVMTLINIVSSSIYTKGLSIKDKIQLYGMALVFLVLLYNSPSGLVMYWTLNNLFSLIKNLFRKLKNSKTILNILIALAGVLLLLYAVLYYPAGYGTLYRLFFAVSFVIMEIPIIRMFFRTKTDNRRSVLNGEPDKAQFIIGCAFLSALTGLLIPSSVILSSPGEFVLVTNFYSPLRHIMYAFLLAAGLFMLWFGIFYFLANEKLKRAAGLLTWIICGTAIVNYMFFGTHLGILSADLKYDAMLQFTRKEIITNIVVLTAIAIAMFIVFIKKIKLTKYIGVVMLTAVLLMSAVNIFKIQAAMPEIRNAVNSAGSERASFTLSKKGKNVIVFMLDRAISGYIPYIFAEKPELEKQFDGFTYYPDTVSYGMFTNFGTPAIFGGYEYTPEEINKRSDELLEEKQNEALKVMPVLFDEAGYEVTVCDPPYAGYQWIPDLSIYKDYPDIRAFVTEKGQFNMLSEASSFYDINIDTQIENVWRRNFFCYSLMKISPLVFQSKIYDDGIYRNANSVFNMTQKVTGISIGRGYDGDFLNSYSVLCSLADMTLISENDTNTFLMMSNSTTHEPMLLQEPEYEPRIEVDNSGYDEANRNRFMQEGKTIHTETSEQMMHYQTNMAAMLKLGEWMDYLRENDVYDNTRIIVIADHGKNLKQSDDMVFEDLQMIDGDVFDVMAVNPLFMVKDFNSTGFTTDSSFMTCGDVPTLAMYELIHDPVNPFTGLPINNAVKNASPQHIIISDDWDTKKNNGSTFRAGIWYSVHDSIFDPDNWELIGEY